MPIQTLCPNPNCRKALTIGYDFSGRSVRCPACKTAFRVAPSVGGSSQLDSVAPEATTPPANRETFPLPPPASPPASTPEAATPAVKDASLPSAIGRYEIRGKLGEGAFGVVYRGHDPFMTRDGAVTVATAKGAKA